MGILRDIVKTITLFLFSISLSSLILTLLFYNLTTHENAKNLFTTLFKEVMMKNESQKIEEIYSKITHYCNLYPNRSIEVLNNITIECSKIFNTNSSYLISLIAEKYFDQLYYKTYECEMPECIKEIKSIEDVVILLSLKAHRFFGTLLQPLLIFTIVLGVLLFISIETWSGRLKVFGFEFLSIGIFYLLIPFFKKIISEKFLREVQIGENILDLIFDKFESILLIFLISGLVLICIWISVKFSRKHKKSK
ncbi:MAG: hypothetical protein QXR09_00905 [Candidatus Aenigmatarchaeota archaeon]